MKIFKYVIRNSSGERKEGVKQAASSSDVLNWLRERKYIPISVEEMFVSAKERKQTYHRKRVKSSDLSAICW